MEGIACFQRYHTISEEQASYDHANNRIKYSAHQIRKGYGIRRDADGALDADLPSLVGHIDVGDDKNRYSGNKQVHCIQYGVYTSEALGHTANNAGAVFPSLNP